MNTIKAIETEYNGYRFRSRLEARWAVFFDSLDIEYEYEKEGYALDSGWYLPDFFIPSFDCWLEVKGVEPTDLETRLCEELSWGTGYPVIMVWGLPFQPEKYNKKDSLNSKISKIYNDSIALYGERMKVFCLDYTDGSAGTQWWDEVYWAVDIKDGSLCICSADNNSTRCFSFTTHKQEFKLMKQIRDVKPAILQDKFFNAAKRMRFEKGNTTKVKSLVK